MYGAVGVSPSLKPPPAPPEPELPLGLLPPPQPPATTMYETFAFVGLGADETVKVPSLVNL